MIFIDKQLYDSNGYLRSLPLLSRLSGKKLKRAIVWEPGRNCNKPFNLIETPIEFIHPSDFSHTDTLTCVFANDEKDEMYSYVDKYVEFGGPSILVVNHPNFIPKKWRFTGKSLESKCSFVPRNFHVELNKYLESNGLNDFQLLETKNLGFIELCYLHTSITSENPKNLNDLFDFNDKRLAISPMWDWVLKILSLKKENKVANVYTFVFNAFRPLVEKNKNVTKIASIFFSFLKGFGYSQEKVRKTRKRNFKDVKNECLLFLEETTEEKLRSIIKNQMERLECQ